MLDWILDEAEHQIGEVFSSPEPERRRPRRRRSWSPRRFRTRRSNESVDRSSVVSVDSSSVTSSSCSSSGSLDSEENRRRYLQQQARMLTQRILHRERSMLRRNKNTGYEADESTSDYNSNVNSNVNSSDTGASSGASYYISALNDNISNGDCDVNRNKSILDDDSVSQPSEAKETDNKIDVERDIQIAVFHCNEMEEENRKRNKLFSLKKKRKRRQFQEHDEEQGRVEIKLSPEELENQTQLAKKQEKRKLCIFTIIVVPLIIFGMAGIGVFLALTWKPDSDSDSNSNSNETSGSSGYPVQDSEGPTIRFSPEYDDNIFYTGDSYTSTTDSSNSAVYNSIPISEETVVPMVDDEVYKKHMEAYERWKQSGGKDEDDDDDDDYSPQVDLDEYLDEISFTSESSGNGGGR